MANELIQVIDQIGRDKGIDRSVLISAIETAVLSASRKKYGNAENIFAKFNEKSGQVEIYVPKKVVSKVSSGSWLKKTRCMLVRKMFPDSVMGFRSS